MMENRLKNENSLIYNINKFALGFAFIITASVWLICYRHSYMIYMSNDDAGIQNMLNGFTAGINNPAHQFISVFLGYPLAWLYKFFPRIQWWFVYSQMLMLLGIFLVNYSFISLAINDMCNEERIRNNRNKKDICIIAVILIIYNISFSIPALSSTSFTVVPAVYGGGVIAILLIKGLNHHVENRFLIIILVLFLPVLLHRKTAGYAVFCYLMLAFFWVLVKNYNPVSAIKKMLIGLLVAVCFLGFFVVADNAYKNRINGEEFVEFNKARVELLDHYMDAYDRKPGLYRAVGWDRDTYIMTRRWCFVDDRCTAENFHYIATNSHDNNSSPDMLINTMLSDKLMKNLIFVFCSISIGTMIFEAFSRDICGIIFAGLNIIGSVILIAFQIMTGRVLYRSLVVVVLPAYIVMSFLMFYTGSIKKQNPSGAGSEEIKKINYLSRKSVLSVLIALIFGIAVFYSGVLAGNFVNLDEIRTNVYSDNDDKIHKYLMNHKDNFYVLQVGIKRNINPRLLYDDDISNSFYWGGSDYHSNIRRYVLHKNGFNSLGHETFLNDNVFLISSESYSNDISIKEKEALEKTSEVYAFCHWMSKMHPDYIMVKTDEIYDGMNVYHFTKRV